MKVFKFTVFFLFITSMYPWFLMNAPTIVLTIISAFMILLSSPKLYYNKSKGNYLFFISLSLMLLWCAIKYNFFGVITTLVSIYVIYVLCTIEDKIKQDVLRYITNGTALIMLFSIPFYILNFIGVPLLHDTITFGKATELENYYFFVKFAHDIRFQSIFLEPGHMTMGIAPLLFLNRYNYKNKAVLVIIIAQLMSLSLAGIIVMMFGLLFTVMLNPSVKRRVKGAFLILLVFSALAAIMYVFFGDEIIQTLILDRLAIKDGQLAGYNRSTFDIDMLYESVVGSSNRWTGVEWDPEVYGSSSGYKTFIITNGLVGAFLAVLSYIMPFLLKKERKMLFFSIILLLLLTQNGYPQWWCMIINLILGPAYYKCQLSTKLNSE